jgi:prepilin-type processing-associated H-X9-DG protein
MQTSKSQGQASARIAFTLVELVVVIALLVIVACTLFPALAKTTPNVQAAQCMNNHRRMAGAWRMYADDSRDMLVYSSDDGTGASNPSNSYAWTWTHMDFDPSNRGNWDTNVDIILRPLWPYTGKDATPYKCPADHSTVVALGTPKPRVRSISMNIYLGGFAGSFGGAESILQFYRLFLKLTDLTAPGPAKTFVFLDMRPDDINWGNFYTDMTGYSNNAAIYQFSDLPGYFHNFGCSFSFGDGHAEVHRWSDPRTTPPPSPTGVGGGFIPSPQNADIAWLQDHATRPK